MCLALLLSFPQAGKPQAVEKTFVVENTNNVKAKQLKTATQAAGYEAVPTGMVLPYDSCPNPVDYVSTKDTTFIFDSRMTAIPFWFARWSTTTRAKPIGVHQFRLTCKPRKQAVWERVATSPYP